MTDAPERIWMDMSDDAIRARGRPYVTQGYLAAPPRTEYLRADLCDRNAILEEAAKVADDLMEHHEIKDGICQFVFDDACESVAAAIRAMKEVK